MTLTGEQIRIRGLAALRRELGRAGLVRFIQHYEKGHGDYTKERPELLAGLTMEDLRSRIKQTKKARKNR